MRKSKIKVFIRNYRVSSDELLCELQRIAASLKQDTLTISQYAPVGRYSVNTLYKRFGGWNLALAKAGLNTVYERSIPDSSLFENLADVWVSLGAQPTCSNLRKPLSRYSHDTYISRFGSWRNALKKFRDYISAAKGKQLRLADVLTKRARSDNSRSVKLTLRFAVMKRDKFKCVLCGRSPAKYPALELEVDHIIPWSKGGKAARENLQTLCAECNAGKGAN